MFTRIVKVRKGKKVHQYLRLVENSWKNGKTRQRVIANFGNLETLDAKKIDSAIASLLRFSSGHFADLHDLEIHSVQHLGELLAGEMFWQELGLDEILPRHLNGQRLSGKAPLLVKTMVLSRLVKPLSKLALTENLHRLAIPRLEGSHFEPHHFYRAMDELIRCKETIEIALHEREKDLFNLNLNLVFYDITSSYLEGDACPLGAHGYSRDHRRDRQQIVIGLLVTDQGLPIAHQVFPGNTRDSTTLTGQVKRLKQRFGIKQCVLVVDRGMVSEDNLKSLRDDGYDYIVALRKRKRALFEPVLRENRDRLAPVDGQGRLTGFESGVSEFGDDRLLFYFNPEKAEVEARHRKERLEKAEKELQRIQDIFISGKRKNREQLLQQAARYLQRCNLSRFFTLQTDKTSGIVCSLKREIVDFESSLDGYFVLRTNRTDLSQSEAVAAYKTLARVESAFKELKNFIDLRPMYHWAERRVEAHVFICVLAYLIEICIEIRLKEANMKMTARKALNLLSDVKLVKQSVGEIEMCTYSKPTPEASKIIQALKLKLPKEKLIVR